MVGLGGWMKTSAPFVLGEPKTSSNGKVLLPGITKTIVATQS